MHKVGTFQLPQKWEYKMLMVDKDEFAQAEKFEKLRRTLDELASASVDDKQRTFTELEAAGVDVNKLAWMFVEDGMDGGKIARILNELGTDSALDKLAQKLGVDVEVDKLARTLNGLGAAGWELVGWERIKEGNTVTVIFKRPVAPAEAG